MKNSFGINIKKIMIPTGTNVTTSSRFSGQSIIQVKKLFQKEGAVCAAIQPIGKQFEPLGEVTFNYAYNYFRKQVEASIKSGADIIFFERFLELAEIRAAVIAAGSLTSLPLICSIEFNQNQKTKNGTDPYIAAHVLRSLGVKSVGTFCNNGAAHLTQTVKMMNEILSNGLFVSLDSKDLLANEADLKHNAKIIRVENILQELVKNGVSLFETQDEQILKSIKSIKSKAAIVEKNSKEVRSKVITSNSRLLSIEENRKYKIGKLNSKSDNTFYNELLKHNYDFITDKIFFLNSKQYDTIYINIDKNAGKNEHFLADFINFAQSHINSPFIIETENAAALDYALKIYKGVAGVIIDETDKKKETELINVVKKYQSLVFSKDILFSV